MKRRSKPERRDVPEGDRLVEDDPDDTLKELQNYLAKEDRQQEQRRAEKWISAHAEQERLKERRGAESWQVRWLKALQGRKFQRFLTILLIVDVLCIFCELFLDAEFPYCRYIERDGTSCCSSDVGRYGSNSSYGDIDNAHRQLAAGHSICPSGLKETSGSVGCDDHKWEVLHGFHDILASTSVSVLIFFQVELFFLLFVLDKLFFYNPLYVLDFFVIASSLLLEIYIKLQTVRIDDADDLLNMVVVLRFWRFMRIGHGIFASTHIHSHGEMKELLKKLHDYQHIMESRAGHVTEPTNVSELNPKDNTDTEPKTLEANVEMEGDYSSAPANGETDSAHENIHAPADVDALQQKHGRARVEDSSHAAPVTATAPAAHGDSGRGDVAIEAV